MSQGPAAAPIPRELTPALETEIRAALNAWGDQGAINTPERVWLDALIIEVDFLRDRLEAHGDPEGKRL